MNEPMAQIRVSALFWKRFLNIGASTSEIPTPVTPDMHVTTPNINGTLDNTKF